MSDVAELHRVMERRAGHAELTMKVDHLHSCMETVKEQMTELKKDVAENTALTSEIRDFFTWGKITRRMVAWGGGIAGGLAGVFELLRAVGVF